MSIVFDQAGVAYMLHLEATDTFLNVRDDPSMQHHPYSESYRFNKFDAWLLSAFLFVSDKCVLNVFLPAPGAKGDATSCLCLKRCCCDGGPALILSSIRNLL